MRPIKSLLVILLAVFFFGGNTISILALENNEGSDQIIEVINEAINVELEAAGQSYPDKAISFKVTVKPTVTLARAKLVWIYDGKVFRIEGDASSIIDLTKDQEFVTYKTFYIDQSRVLLKEREFDFGVKVDGSAYDYYYLTRRKETIKLNTEYEATPYLTGYEQQKNTITILRAALWVTLSGLIIWASVVGITKFRAYINSD